VGIFDLKKKICDQNYPLPFRGSKVFPIFVFLRYLKKAHANARMIKARLFIIVF